MINPSNIDSAFKLLLTNTINPKIIRIMRVTTLSTCANIHEEYWETSIIFTRKSSFISLKIVSTTLAIKSRVRKGMKFLNSSHRCLPFSVSRFDFMAMSSAVGCGSRLSAYPNKASRGRATPPIRAGIQNSLMFKVSMTYKPADLAVPELMTILTPSKLARMSVIRLPSIKLKMIPHIHPSESPFRNMAPIL